MRKRPALIILALWLLIVLAYDFLIRAPQWERAWQNLENILADSDVVISGIVDEVSGSSTQRKYLLSHVHLMHKDTLKTDSGYGQNDNITNANEILPRGCKVLVYAKTQTDAACGDFLFTEGKVVRSAAATNPGQFNAKQYDYARKIFFRVYEANVLEKQSRGGVMAWLQQLRSSLSERYRVFLEEKDAAVMAAMTLGAKEELDPELKKLYQDGGIGHILAISGLHVNLIGMMLYQFLRKRRASFRLSAAVSGSVLIAYCMMTGASASNLRAVILFLFWAGSQVFGRKTDLPIAITGAATVILTMCPGYIREAGFWLSFGSVISLRLFTEPVRRLLPGFAGQIRGLSESIAITLGTLPLICRFFFQITPYSVLVNLIVIPCLSILMIFLLLASTVSLISAAGASFFAAPCHYLLAMFKRLCLLERVLPGGILITGCPGPIALILYYCVLTGVLAPDKVQQAYSVCRNWLIVILRKSNKTRTAAYSSGERWRFLTHRRLLNKTRTAEITGAAKEIRRAREMRQTGKIRSARKKRSTRLLHSVVLLCGIFLLLFRARPAFRIRFLDIGQGDCILIDSSDGTFLVDCGSSSLDNIWEYRVFPALRYYGIRSLDGIFLSHGDADHVNGVTQALDAYETGLCGQSCSGLTIHSLIVSRPGLTQDNALAAITGMAMEKGIKTVLLEKSDLIESGRLSFNCIYPGEENLTGDVNENSMVLLLRTAHAELY